MKIGQLVMLVQTGGILPPRGATGEIHSDCCMANYTRVMFGHHKNQDRHSDGAFCVKKSWLVPIDDADGSISREDQLELDLSHQDLVKIGRRMLEDLEKEDA
jgi:hypothetical protein